MRSPFCLGRSAEREGSCSALLARIERAAQQAGEFRLDILDRERIRSAFSPSGRRFLGLGRKGSGCGRRRRRWADRLDGPVRAGPAQPLPAPRRDPLPRSASSRRRRARHRPRSARQAPDVVLVADRPHARSAMPRRRGAGAAATGGGTGLAGRFRASSSCLAISESRPASGAGRSAGRPLVRGRLRAGRTGSGGMAARAEPAAPASPGTGTAAG